MSSSDFRFLLWIRPCAVSLYLPGGTPVNVKLPWSSEVTGSIFTAGSPASVSFTAAIGSGPKRTVPINRAVPPAPWAFAWSSVMTWHLIFL